MKVVIKIHFLSVGISHFPEPSAWSCHVKNILKSYQNNYFAHEKTLQQQQRRRHSVKNKPKWSRLPK